jgi:outer membrane protein assembly factor BamB
LLDRWPEDGPKLIWKSEKIPGLPTGGRANTACVGGCGSVTVANGKAYVYSHCQYKGGKVKVPTEMLERWGWAQGVPEDLARKLEQARKDRKRPRSGAARDTYISDFLAALGAAQAKKFETCIRTRLTGGKFSWGALEKLATVRDKEFNSVREVARAAGVSLHPHSETAGIMTPVAGTGRRIADALICLDADTGQQLWTTEFPGKPGGHYNYGASGTPSVTDGKCYFAGSAGTYCISAEDGKEIWKAETGFTDSSPLVRSGRVYVCYKDGLKAFDAASGELLWTQPQVSTMYISPSPWERDGKTCVVTGSSPVPRKRRRFDLICVDAETGGMLWEAHTTFHYSTPAVSGDIAVTFNKGNASAHRLSLEAGKRLWSSREKYDERGGSAVVYQGHAYMVGGGYRNSGAHCYDLETGELKWTHEYAHTETGSAVLADGKVFAFAAEKRGKRKARTVVMFKASPDGYEELGVLRNTSAGTSFNKNSSPTVANGKLFLRLRDAIACYDLRK